MSFLNNDFEPWPKQENYGDRSLNWSEDDEYYFQQEQKRKEEELECGLHFRS